MGLFRSAINWITGKRSLENPSTPLSAPDDWLYDALGSYRTSSGTNVNPQTALTLAAWWRGLNLVSRKVGQVPLYVYRRDERGKCLDRQHPAYKLLRRKPNPEMTSFTLKQTLQAHVMGHGNGYAYIRRNKAARPLELLPLSPVATYPVREGTKLWYVTTIEMGDGRQEMRKLKPEDLLHLKGLGYDGLEGYSVYSKARESLGEAMGHQTFGSIFYRNSARPNVVLTHPARLDDKAKNALRENWERMHAGLENAHRTAILDQGLQIKEMSINARDAQFIESRKLSVREIANWLHLPPHKLGDDSKTSYNSLEQENQAFLDDGLDPWFVMWEEECWDKLLTEEEKESGSHEIEFFRRALVRADAEKRSKYYQAALQSGWMNRDEVREEDGYNPIAGGEGSRYFLPMNMQLTEPAGDEEDGEISAAAGQPAGELLDVPDVRQAETWDCGAAAALAVSKYFAEGPATLAAAIAEIGTTPEAGTSPEQLLAYFTRLGLNVTSGQEWSIEDLARAYQAGRPVLCAVQTDAPADQQQAETQGHWVVVIGVGLGQVMYQDPRRDIGGRRMLSAEEFLKNWHDKEADGTEFLRFGLAVGVEPFEPLPEEEEEPTDPNSPQDPAAEEEPDPEDKPAQGEEDDAEEEDQKRTRVKRVERDERGLVTRIVEEDE